MSWLFHECATDCQIPLSIDMFTTATDETYRLIKEDLFARLVTELSKLFSNSLEFRELSGLSGFSDFVELLFIESAGFELSLLFELFNEGLLLPANGMGQVTQAAVFSVILHSDNLKSIRDDLSLLVVIWWWDTFESF